MSQSLPYKKEFEQIVLTGNVEDALKSLVPNSKEQLYVRFIEELKSCKKESKISNKLIKIIKDIDNITKDHRLVNECELKKNLLEFDLPTTNEKRKKEIIDDLGKKYHGLRFNHRPPDFATKLDKKEDNIKKEPSILSDELLKQLMDKYYKDNSNNQIFEFVNTYDLKKNEVFAKILKSGDNEKIKRILDTQFNPFFLLKKDEFLLLIDYLNKTNIDYSKKFNLCNFTTEQIEMMLDKVKNEKAINLNDTMENYINKVYLEKLNNVKEQNNLEEQRKILLEIYDKVKNNPALNNYTSSIIYHLLSNGIEINNYDLDLFLNYLKNPFSFIMNFDYIFKIKNNYLNNRAYNTNFFDFDYDKVQRNELVNQYLEYFFMNKKADINTFKNYIKEDYLEKYLYKAQILTGEISTFNEKFMSKKEYEDLCKLAEITICPHNKKCFEIDEPVILDLDIKNIPNLTLSIFTINTENYYLDKKQPITSLINVEGLLTSSEMIFNYNEKPQKRHRERINLDKIPNNKRGVYLIEIIGNGISSRAIIKKGTLNLITRSTSKGKLCYIINEKNEIMKSNNTYIWYNGNKYKCEIEKGMIVIPYSSFKAGEDKCILFSDDYSDIANIQIDREVYRLKGHFNLNHSSIITGNMAKVTFKPLILINDRQTSISILKNNCIKINLTKEEDGNIVPISNTINNIKFNENEEYEFEVQIPPLFKSISYTFECDVMNLSTHKLQHLTYSQSENVDNKKNSKTRDIFLRKVNNGNVINYIVEVIGKNGEVIPDLVLPIEINFKYLNQNLSFNLRTDDKGQINLGPLKNVVFVKINYETIFNIRGNSKYSYPESIDIIKGENIILPYYREDVLDDILLIKYSDENSFNPNSNVIEVLDINNTINFKKLEIPNDKDNYFEIMIHDLKEGKYILIFSDDKININVHEGTYWENISNFIMEKNQFCENVEVKLPIYMDKLIIDKENSEIKFSLKNQGNDSNKIHAKIFMYEYLPNNFNQFFENYSSLLVENIEMKTLQPFTKWKNIYLSNRILNEEIQYVLQRKNYDDLMGNSLEMPSLLLKRQFTKVSEIEEEKLEKGNTYKKKDAEMAKKTTKNYGTKSSITTSSFVKPMISDFQNFIKNLPIILTNVKSNNNEFEIKFPDKNTLNKFSFIQIVLIDDKSINSNLITLQDEKYNVEKRSICNEKILDNEKNYSEIKKTEIHLKGKEFSISETSNDKIIDSIEKLINYLFIKNSHFNNDWQKLSFLLNLDEGRFDEKKFLENLSENISHEVNIFLYFKYPKIFEKYIKDILKYKFEKTFIDYFLLGDIETLEMYLNTEKIAKLNLFELCLLIITFIEKKPEECKNIRNIIESRIKKENIDQILLRNFDIMMNMKSDDKIEKEKLEIREQKRLEEMELEQEDLGDDDDSYENECAIDVEEENMINPNQFIQEEERRFRGRSIGNRMNPPIREGMREGMDRAFGAANYMNIAPTMTSFNMNNNALFATQAQQLERIRASMMPMMASNMMNLNQADFRMMEQSSAFQNAVMMNKIDAGSQYEKPGEAKEYKERHYLFRDHKNKLYSPLWLDFADYILKEKKYKDFLSKYILYDVDNICELIWIISIFDLPIQSIKHEYKRNESNNRMIIITPNSNLLLFTKEICEAKIELNNKLLISQNLINVSHPNSYGTDDENNIMIGDTYNHEIILTNISNKKLDFDIFVQIPEGSVPLNKTYYTQTHHIRLDSFITSSYITTFYFPNAGTFKQYHPLATKEGVVISIGNPLTYTVKTERVLNIDNTNNDENNKYAKDTHVPGKLSNILATGDKNNIYNYFENDACLPEDVSLVLWLAKDKEFFNKLIGILRNRGIFNSIFWGYGFMHYDIEAIKEYLNDQYSIKEELGEGFSSSLITNDEIYEPFYTPHLDYAPLFNARVHPLGKRESHIDNEQFKETYQKFIIQLMGMDKINARNLLRLTYYLILQERIDEAFKIFKKIDPKDVIGDEHKSEKLQYDYINAYIDFCLGYPKFEIATEVCTKYKNFPLLNWREKFEEIENQLFEYTGKEIVSMSSIEQGMESMDLDKKQSRKELEKELKEKEPRLSFSIKEKKLEIIHSNISNISIKFYPIDLETLFSRSPEISSMINGKSENDKAKDNFCFVVPNYSTLLKIEENKINKYENLTIFEIPEEFNKKNIFIEVSSESFKVFDMYFSSNLKVMITESIGELKVIDDKLKPVIKAYVKVYSKDQKGETTFYKDGYTDLRGKFDYLSLNTDQLKNATKFYIFVSEDNLGSIIQECKPPANVNRSGDSQLEEISKYRQNMRNEWRIQNKL